MASIHPLLLVLACISFVLELAGVPAKISWVALGLLLWCASSLV